MPPVYHQQAPANPSEGLIADMLKMAGEQMAKETPKMPLWEYFREAWKVIEPRTPLIDNWHFGYIGEHLEAVTKGDIKKLLVNMPPRYLKSTFVTVMWPTWEWGPAALPWLRYLCASYSSDLSTDHNIKRRDLIRSAFYQEKWGEIVRLAEDQNEKTKFKNSAMGEMVATSVGGTATGKGGDRIVIDDLLNPKRANSDAERLAALNFYDLTLSTRLNDPKNGAMVIVEQRLHPQDLTAHALTEGDWVHIDVQAQAEKRRTYVFPLSKTAKVMEEGEVLCAARQDAAMLLKQKTKMGSRGFNAQYQQNPGDEETSIFPRSWWQYYRKEALPYVLLREWHWDTAQEDGEENCFNVGILFAHCANGTYIEKVVREKLKYPDLKRTVRVEWDARPANRLVIENKSSGISLGQDLKRGTKIPIKMYDKPGDKIFCANLASPIVESGRVYLPEGEPWVADFLDELALFPNADYDDQVDAFSQGINHHYQNGGNPYTAMSEANIHGKPLRGDWE